MFGSDEGVAVLDRLADLVRQRDRLDAEVASLVAHADSMGAWSAGPHLGARRFLRHHSQQSAVSVRVTMRRSWLLGRFGRTAAAATSGELCLGAVDALAAVVTASRARCFERDEALLLSHASSLPLEDLEALLDHWAELSDDEVDPSHEVASWRQHLAVQQRFDGGADLFGSLDEQTAQTLLAALDAFDPGPDPLEDPHRRCLRQRRADALGEVSAAALQHGDPSGGTASPSARPRPPVSDTTIVVDVATIAGRSGAADLHGLISEINGRTVSGRAIASLLCDSWVSAVLVDARGAAIDATERSAPFTSSQRRLLAARDRGCVVPGCDRPPSHCDAHHVVPRSAGGPNTLDNACLLCRRHHRLVHHGWVLGRPPGSTGGWTITSPTGRVWCSRTALGRHGFVPDELEPPQAEPPP